MGWGRCRLLYQPLEISRIADAQDFNQLGVTGDLVETKAVVGQVARQNLLRFRRQRISVARERLDRIEKLKY